MGIGRWKLERPPRYSRPLLRLAPFVGVVGQLGMLPIIYFERSWKSPRVMVGYVIADFVVCGVVMALAVRFMVRLKRKLRGAGGAICPECGYDLRGLGEKGACPECGRAFEREADVAYWRRHVGF